VKLRFIYVAQRTSVKSNKS